MKQFIKMFHSPKSTNRDNSRVSTNLEDDFVVLPPNSPRNSTPTLPDLTTVSTNSSTQPNSQTSLPVVRSKNKVNCPICGLSLFLTDQQKIDSHIEDCLKRNNDDTPPSSSPPKVYVPKPEPIVIKPPPPQPKEPPVPSIPPTIKPSVKPTPVQSFRNNQRSDYHTNNYNDSPFAITCPYDYCNMKMEAKDFYAHANSQHSAHRQNFACPVCKLLGYTSYTVNQSTNLLQHLTRNHPDLITNTNTYVPITTPPVKKIAPTNDQWIDPAFYDQGEDFIYDPSQFVDDVYISEEIISDLQTIKQTIGSKYVEDVIKEYKAGVECTICMEEFDIGDSIARMDCFCTFHKSCIDSWLKKASKCPLHKD